MGAAATALLVAAAAMLLGGPTLHRQAQQEQLLTAVADLDSEFSALSQRESMGGRSGSSTAAAQPCACPGHNQGSVQPRRSYPHGPTTWMASS
jgi:hypothetical protein